jgi:hypothetical protein
MKDGKGKMVLVGLVVFCVSSSSLGLSLVTLMEGRAGVDGSMGREGDGDAQHRPMSSPTILEDRGEAAVPGFLELPGTDWPIGPVLSPEGLSDATTAKATLVDALGPPSPGPKTEAVPTTPAPEPLTQPVMVPEGPEVPVVPVVPMMPVVPVENGNVSMPGLILLPEEQEQVPELERLAQLEGCTDFSRTTGEWPYDGGYGQGQGQGNGMGVPDAETDTADREIEESDIVKQVGDILYVLNPYRGLIAIDLADPDDPVVLGSAPVLGTPVDMYIVGGKAYVIVSCDFGYWYGFSRSSAWWDWYWPRYQIGSRLVIVDLDDPSDPDILIEYPIEGFVSDSRRVGDVLYYVATCHSWYNEYTWRTMDDLTYVLSVDIADPFSMVMVDTISFPGRSYVIHVTTEHLYVSQWDFTYGKPYGTSNITLVDISDPYGHIAVMDQFPVGGRVENKYQMDEYDGTFRIVGHYRSGRVGESELFTFDIRDPTDVTPLGHLLIDDAGNLMATRFAGDRGYTIHLPRSIDPLDVLDLSDPADPKLCDVFEMPGWVTHMEVRGYKILALGVDDSGGQRNIAVSLFDVTDPWNVVMVDRVRFGGRYSSSAANVDPKALTVLDDQGLVLVPYSGYDLDESGRYRYRSGVQLVSFDLEGSNLELRGEFDQPDSVLRTRSLGDRVLSTSTAYLIIADTTDLDAPEVTAMVELCPMVLDYKDVDGRYIEIVSTCEGGEAHLRVFADGQDDLNPPLQDVDLGSYIARWFWDGDLVHVLTLSFTDGDYYNYEGTVKTYTIAEGTVSLTASVSYNGCDYNALHPFIDDIRLWHYYGSMWLQRNDMLPSNPVLLDSGTLAIYGGGTLHLIDLDFGLALSPISTVPVELDVTIDGFVGIVPAGEGLYLVGYSHTHMVTSDGGRRCLIRYPVIHVGLEGTGTPSVGDPVLMPGMALGASADGSRVYTTCSWRLADGNAPLETLNVVQVEGGEAVIVGALDITGTTGCMVTDDAAVVTKVISENLLTLDGHDAHLAQRTAVYVVDLTTCLVRTGYVVDGAYEVFYAGTGIALLRSWEKAEILVIDLERDDGPVVSIVSQSREIVAVRRCGDTVQLVRGRYGLLSVDMGDRPG